jgi:hypothetical protein
MTRERNDFIELHESSLFREIEDVRNCAPILLEKKKKMLFLLYIFTLTQTSILYFYYKIRLRGTSEKNSISFDKLFQFAEIFAFQKGLPNFMHAFFTRNYHAYYIMEDFFFFL